MSSIVNNIKLSEEDKIYICNNFKNLSASKIAKDLNKKHIYSQPFTGTLIYNIVNSIRTEINKEIVRLKDNGQVEKSEYMKTMVKLLLPNKKQRVYRNIDKVVDRIFS